MAHAFPTLKENHVVKKDWCVTGRAKGMAVNPSPLMSAANNEPSLHLRQPRHFLDHEGSHDGWSYSAFFRSKMWSDVKSWKHTCRRRFWRRTTIDQDALGGRESAGGGGAAEDDAAASREEKLGSLGKALLASNLEAATGQMT